MSLSIEKEKCNSNSHQLIYLFCGVVKDIYFCPGTALSKVGKRYWPLLTAYP